MIFGENLSDSEKWDSIRGERNRMLLESDWTQLEDSSVNKREWASYRQSLREIPQTIQNPDLVVWPKKP
jgi:hypothetical protein